MASKIDALQEDLSEMKGDMKTVLYILKGNGHPGLVQKVSRNTQWRWVLKGGWVALGVIVSILAFIVGAV